MLCCGAVIAYKFAVTSIVTLECLINGEEGGGIFEKSINGGLNKGGGYFFNFSYNAIKRKIRSII